MSEAIVPRLKFAGGAVCSSETGMLKAAVMFSKKVLTEDILFTGALGGSI